MQPSKLRWVLPFACMTAFGLTLVPELAEARYVRNTTRTNVNPNVYRTRNVNVNRNYDVHRDIDLDVDYRDRHHYPAATAVGVAAAATVTAVAVGSIVHSIPPSCTTTMINGFTYKNCDGTWYSPRYSGTQVNYVVVNPPY